MARPTYKRAERVADQIQMEVADILARKSKDPRLAMVTVTDVRLSGDLRIANVLVTTLQEGDAKQQVFEGLQRAVGFIRGELGRRLGLKYTPDVTFCWDSSGLQGARIDQLLDQLNLGNKEGNTDGGAEVLRAQ